MAPRFLAEGSCQADPMLSETGQHGTELVKLIETDIALLKHGGFHHDFLWDLLGFNGIYIHGFTLW